MNCFPLDSVDLLDLSHSLDEKTIFWPGGESFSLCVSVSGSDSDNDFYAAGSFSCAEHGGTHIDAPYHFAEGGLRVSEIAIQSLVGACRCIDVSTQVERFASSSEERDYEISVEDILRYEEWHGVLREKDIVVFHTGWAKHYIFGAKAYLGFDERVEGPYDVDKSELSFPGLGERAAQLLVERKVAGVGLDTASLDRGSSYTFIAHRTLLSAGLFGIENLNAETEKLPPVGATIAALPLKITGGTGAPTRVVAFVPKAR